MSCCKPTQSCASDVPETCEALPTVVIGTRVVVENESSCKRTLQSPSNPSVLQHTKDGGVEWRDGSDANPIQLDSVQEATEVESVIGRKSTGEEAALPATAGAAEEEVLTNEGSGWKAKERSKIFGAGSGILIRGLSGLAAWLNGSVGQILKIGTSGYPEWGDTSTWITKTANYVANNGDQILADTTAGPFSITLPSTPSDGDEVTLCDKAKTWVTNNLTVNRNGEKIDGLSENLTCNSSGRLIRLIFNGTISTWEIYT